MTGKNTVDDYYGALKASDTDKSGDKTAWEKKIKIKPKKIIKKVIVAEKLTEIQEKSEPKKVEKVSEKQFPKKKQFVQKMEVVKTEPVKKEFKKEFKKDFKKDGPSSFKKDYKKDNSSSFKRNEWQKTEIKKDKPTFRNEDKTAFKKDTSRGKSGWEDRDNKKSKLKPFNKSRNKARFSFYEERNKEVTFTRSNKIAKKKKEETKIEDIKQNLIDHTWETIVISDILSLKELSEKTWITLPKLLAEFMKNGMMVNINSKIDFDSATIVCEVFEIKLERDESVWLKVEDLMSWDISSLLIEEDSSKLQARPPVISIMGHVDHGKTSLLDYIRSAKVAAGEAWGITQSIWAYQVEQNWQKITFLDTPGHEAFTVMRARWAKATDIAILVVAADEGVKPQTIESINHAKEAGIPVVVAINKMDKEWANPDHVKGQLAEHGLTPEDWGGDTPMIPVSAQTGFGIDDLLEIILLVAEMKELKANPDRAWIATVLESHLDLKLWPIATVLVNTWTINKTDNIVCNDAFWKIKVLKNHENKWVIKAIPWDPILIVWLDRVVSWGDVLQVVANAAIAREKATEYKEIVLKNKAAKSSGLDILMWKIKAWNLKQLKIVVKSDTNGSLEAIKSALQKLSTPETTVQIIHSWVWNITEWDVLMCQWSSAILVGFWVSVVTSAKTAIEDTRIEFISSDIIYHITERIEKIVSWMLDPKEVETILSRAKVLAIFFTEKKFMIIWLKLTEEWDKIESWALIRVIRKKKVVWHGKVASLKQWVEEVKSLEGPIECWIKFEWSMIIEEGDELEVYKIEIEK